MTQLTCYSYLRHLVPNTEVTVCTQVKCKTIDQRKKKKTHTKSYLEKQSIIDLV